MSTFPTTEHSIVFYESVHRIEKTLMELSEVLASQPDRPVVICRELTKMHEEIIYTKIGNVGASSQDAPTPGIAKTITKKGEFVIIIGAYNL